MVKKLSKRKQMNMIAADVGEIKATLKKLLRQQLLLADVLGRLATKAPPKKVKAAPKQKPVESRAASEQKSAPARPVLVKAAQPITKSVPGT